MSDDGRCTQHERIPRTAIRDESQGQDGAAWAGRCVSGEGACEGHTPVFLRLWLYDSYMLSHDGNTPPIHPPPSIYSTENRGSYGSNGGQLLLISRGVFDWDGTNPPRTIGQSLLRTFAEWAQPVELWYCPV